MDRSFLRSMRAFIAVGLALLPLTSKADVGSLAIVLADQQSKRAIVREEFVIAEEGEAPGKRIKFYFVNVTNSDYVEATQGQFFSEFRRIRSTFIPPSDAGLFIKHVTKETEIRSDLDRARFAEELELSFRDAAASDPHMKWPSDLALSLLLADGSLVTPVLGGVLSATVMNRLMYRTPLTSRQSWQLTWLGIPLAIAWAGPLAYTGFELFQTQGRKSSTVGEMKAVYEGTSVDESAPWYANHLPENVLSDLHQSGDSMLHLFWEAVAGVNPATSSRRALTGH